jgi:hypothetical protein
MIKKLFIIAIIGVIGYSIYMVAEVHYNYWAFKSDVEKYLRVAINIPKRVKEDIYEIVDQYNIPLEDDEISITREGRIYVVRASWSETIDFFTLYQKTFYFEVDTSRQ